ncbi:surface-adhesin E family protein [Caulobacter mirabilis]|uniref:Surface-adhesin protein E-like domain-containing protein n=1 Tax=Caulobacter mirabilis TaxID=69666 RepID=A0A2D2B0M8_9CAUL|nr:surface-adhesin E family protein [Caulobacter mirabilis]ATQ43799.1 hypothetical protein CSW64_16055 [Caulobacter mirabilis]
MSRIFIVLAGWLIAAPALAQPLRPVEVGRFAKFMDLASIQRTGDAVTFRYLLVVDEDFEAGGQRFLGGWSYMSADCGRQVIDLTGFQSVRADRSEGPRTVDAQPSWPIAPGSVDELLAGMACDGARAENRPDAKTVDEAVTLGRKWLSEGP